MCEKPTCNAAAFAYQQLVSVTKGELKYEPPITF